MQINIKNAKKVLRKYLNDDIKKREHSIRVAKISEMLAKKNNVNIEEAIIAGLLHDIGKSMIQSKMIELCAKRGVELYDFEIFEVINSLHGKAGAILFEQEFERDFDVKKFDRIKHAILAHVAGAPDKMTDLDKIVYIADNVEREKILKGNRKEDVEELLKIANGNITDLNECIKIVVNNKRYRANLEGRICNPMMDCMIDNCR